MVAWSQFCLYIIEKVFHNTYLHTKGSKKQQICIFIILTKKLLSFQYLNIFLITCSLGVFLKLGYEYSLVHWSNDYTWKGRIWWSSSLCYIIFTCLNGQGGFINWFLSHPRWQPLSRLSFNIFMVHQTIIVLIYADRKVAWYYSAFTQVKKKLWLPIQLKCIKFYDSCTFRYKNLFQL